MANKVSLTSSGITVTCERGDTETYKALEGLYPIHSNRIGTIHSLSIRKAPEVLQRLRGLSVDNAHTAPSSVQAFLFNELSARSKMESLISNGAECDTKFSERLTLKPHQELGREIARVRNKYGFFFDTRTGKTPLSLTIIHDDVTKHPDHKWLIVCPLVLIESAWLEDAAKFVPDLKIINCWAPTKAKRLKAMQQSANIYVTNTESFVSYKEYYDKMGFHGCIVDESSDMKSHKSQQSKALVDFAHTMKRFYLLSGTPAPNGEHEYYMQLKALDPYCVPPSYTAFKEHYFVNTSFNPQYEKLVLRSDRKDELLTILREYSLYVDKEDVLDTPGRTFIEYPIEMPDAVKKFYRDMKNNMSMDIDENTSITVTAAAAKINKLNQISSGFVMDTQAIKENKFYDDSNLSEWYLLDNFRFEALKDLLSSDTLRDNQVLIWANYHKEFELIQSLLGERCRCVYGRTSIDDKTEAIRLFKQNKIQYLIANPASADKGLTLTNAHVSIYFSLNSSYEQFKQSMDRIYGDRAIQPHHCLYYIFIAKGSIDSILYNDVLQNKATASMAILNHLKEEQYV